MVKQERTQSASVLHSVVDAIQISCNFQRHHQGSASSKSPARSTKRQGVVAQEQCLTMFDLAVELLLELQEIDVVIGHNQTSSDLCSVKALSLSG